MPDPFNDIRLFVEAGDEFLKGINNVPAVFGWDDERLVAIIPGAFVSKRRAPAPAPLLEGLLHAIGGAFAFDVILKLRKGANDITHKISDGVLFIIFCC